MAVKTSICPEFGTGTLMCKIVDLKGPDSYTTGGVTVSASDFGFSNVAFVSIESQESSGVYFAQIRQAAGGPGASTFTMQWFIVATASTATLEVGSGSTALATLTIRVMAYGN